MTSKRPTARDSARFRAMRRSGLVYRRSRRIPLLRRFGIGNKWLYILFLVVLPLLYVSSVLYARTHTQYYLVTGPKGGAYALLGERMTNALNMPDEIERVLHLNIVPDFVVKESCGAFDNLYAINHGLAQIGFAEDGLPVKFEKTRTCLLQGSDSALREQKQSDKLRMRALMPLYRSPLQIVARRASPFSDVRMIPPHAKVYIGADGSATEYVASVLLSHYGMRIERVGQKLDMEQAVQAMLNHAFDVGFFLTALNTGAIHKLSQSEDFKLLSVTTAPSLKLFYPYFDEIVVPAATFHGASKDVLTIGTNTILVASTDLSETEAYEAAEKIAGHIQDIVDDIPFNFAKSVDNDPGKELYYPLHQGAVRFYNHNPPLFLNPHMLAGIGTYLSVLFASWKLSRQFIRNYRVHRILHAVDMAVLAFHMKTSHARLQRYQHYAQQLRQKALGLLRFHRITMDDYTSIVEYMRGQSHSQTINPVVSPVVSE